MTDTTYTDVTFEVREDNNELKPSEYIKAHKCFLIARYLSDS
jgi:hypothetical protein